jgi:heat shock protein HslJ
VAEFSHPIVAAAPCLAGRLQQEDLTLMNKRRLFAGALSASLLVSALPGLAFAQDEDTSYLAEGVPWALSEMSGQPLADLVEVTLFLSGGDATGNAGCNSYFGSYEIDAATLAFPNPFGVTSMICEGPVQEVEDAYLPLLQSTALWFVDGDGVLSLSDADGNVLLTYTEPPVEVTATDVATLDATLADLQSQVDTALVEVAALEEAAKSINVNKLQDRLTAVEDQAAATEARTKGINGESIKGRVKTNEKDIAALQTEVSNLKKRVKDLENVAKDHEARISAIEDLVPVPEPS